MYADYTFYTNTYHGTKLAAADYSYYAERASDYLDDVTNGRITADILADSGTETLIKKACCAAADEMLTADSGGAKSSESVGDYSVSYASGNTESGSVKLNRAVKLYLGRTGLMYRGAR